LFRFIQLIELYLLLGENPTTGGHMPHRMIQIQSPQKQQSLMRLLQERKDLLHCCDLIYESLERALDAIDRQIEEAEAVAQAKRDARNARRRARYHERKLEAWTQTHEEEVERFRSCDRASWDETQDWAPTFNEF
jgi:hypothetical protein